MCRAPAPAMRKFYKKFSLKTYRLLRHPKHRKKSRVHNWLATRVFDRAHWQLARKTLAGGIAVGLTVSMLPPIPVQMLVAAVIAVFVRVNIPAAAAACWFSNPLTWVPIITTQQRIGEALIPSPAMAEGMDKAFMLLRTYALGAIVMGAVLAITGYLLSLLVWDIVMLVFHRRKNAKLPTVAAKDVTVSIPADSTEP